MCAQGSSTKCDSFNNLHISFIDRTVLLPIHSAVYFLIFELNSSLLRLRNLKKSFSRLLFWKMWRIVWRFCWIRSLFHISVFKLLLSSLSSKCLLHIKILLLPTIFHLGGFYFSIFSEIWGKFFPYPLLGSSNLIFSWLRSICATRDRDPAVYQILLP